MSTTLPFLFELGVEEIPHWMIEPALADLDRLFQQFLSQHGFEAGTVKLVGTETDVITHNLNLLLTDDSAYRQMSFAHNPYGDGKACARILETLSEIQQG